MNFIAPSFLWALFLLGIPVIIHLFNFRRYRKIHFTNVALLKEIKLDNRSKSNLKHLLILLARLLAVLLLVLAFAQPFIPSKHTNSLSQTKNLSIYIDNSFSMDASGTTNNLLEEAKEKALAIVNAYGNDVKFQIINNNFKSNDHRWLGLTAARDEIAKIKTSPQTRSAAQIYNRQINALNDASNAAATLFWISDFQKSNLDFNLLPIDTNHYLNLLPLAANQENNIAIDTCYLTNPYVQLNVPADLIVEVINHGKESIENLAIKLLVNGSNKAVTTDRLEPGERKKVKLSFTINKSGWQNANVQLADFPVTFDNNYYLSFNVVKQLSVLLLCEREMNQNIKTVFTSDPFYEFNSYTINQIDFSAFSRSDLIICEGIQTFSSGLILELEKILNAGKNLLLIPSANINIASYNQLLNAYNIGTLLPAEHSTSEFKVSKVELKHPFFKGVFEDQTANALLNLPTVNAYYPLKTSQLSNGQQLLSLINGDSYTSIHKANNGNIILMTSPITIEHTNLSRHALFVPILLRAAMLQSGMNTMHFTIGKSNSLSFSISNATSDKMVRLFSNENKIDFTTELINQSGKSSINLLNLDWISGNYQIFTANDTIGSVGANYNRAESNLSVYSNEQLSTLLAKKFKYFSISQSQGATLTNELKESEQGTPLWKWCILGCLIMLLAEVLIIKYLTNKTIEGNPRA
ncbi:MAG: hypothetical protein RIQ89_804 [Bacteroidota bacterium]|jgi:hypothetical protein